MTHTAQQLCEMLNISHRQLDHWCRKGWLQPNNPNPGKGHNRAFSPAEVAAAARMAALVHAGVAPERAATYARHQPHLTRSVAAALAATPTRTADLDGLHDAADAIDLQLLNGADEVVLPRDAAELVACALHDLLGQPRKIAAAREDVPALVAEIERLTGEPTEDEIDRDELRRLLAEATPRPWIAEVSGKTGPIVMDAQSVSALDHVAKCPHYRGSADSELIAAAVNALPGLLDALEKAEGHRDSLAATLIEVQRERLGLEAAVERVRALHGLCRTCDPARDPHCDCCDEDWPCLTISALHGGE